MAMRVTGIRSLYGSYAVAGISDGTVMKSPVVMRMV